jgi:hypothetical protein
VDGNSVCQVSCLERKDFGIEMKLSALIELRLLSSDMLSKFRKHAPLSSYRLSNLLILNTKIYSQFNVLFPEEISLRCAQ